MPERLSVFVPCPSSVIAIVDKTIAEVVLAFSARLNEVGVKITAVCAALGPFAGSSEPMVGVVAERVSLSKIGGDSGDRRSGVVDENVAAGS